MDKHQKYVDGYRIGTPVGYGAGSVIYRAKAEKDGSQVAVKYISVEQDTNPNVIRHLENEYDVLSKLHEAEDAPAAIVHPFDLCHVRKWFKLRGVYMVEELVKGESLWKCRDLSIEEQLQILEQLCGALRYMHGLGYVHGDLKPENVLITKNRAMKLIDFGFAAPVGSSLDGIKGTWGYLAPEQTGGVLNGTTDIFNLGALMYWLFTGEQLPNIVPGDNGEEGFVPSDDFKLTPPLHLNPNISPDLSDLVMDCCSSEAINRPFASAVCERIKDVKLRMQLDGAV